MAELTKVYIDPGHGGTDSGAVGNGLKEKDLTLTIAKRVRDILAHEYEGVAVKMSRTGDMFPSLKHRTDDANSWGAHFFLSIHINAFNASANGFETFTYSGTKAPTTDYQNAIHSEIMAQIGINDRGKKQKNLHVLRETDMPAVLTENGFIDSSSDASKMKDSAWLEKVSRGHVNGLAKAFNLKRKVVAQPQQTETDGALYKVQVGAFANKSNADRLVSELKSKGYSAIVVKQ